MANHRSVAHSSAPVRSTRRRRLFAELLEDRATPATFIVNSLLDGAPAADTFLTLREAVTAATTNAASGDATAGDAAMLDTITFAPNLFGGTITLNTGELALSGGGALSITGLGGSPNGVTISGNNASRVFNITSADPVNIFDLTVAKGKVIAAGEDGGAILNSGPNTTLTNVLVTQSSAVDDGGGIHNSGTLTLVNSVVSDNAAMGNGGGVNSVGAGKLTVSNSQVVGNRAMVFGGGIASSTGMTDIGTTTIAGNVATNNGGGLEFLGSSTGTVRNSTISGNFTFGAGGGVRIADTATATILNSTIAYNIADGGAGGGVSVAVAGNTVTIVNSTIVGNADTSNAAEGAGGIAGPAGSTINLVNSVVSLNSAGPGSVDDNVDPGDLDTNTNNFLGGVPLLGPLQSNGGPTFTMLPLIGSPLIDAALGANATETGAAGGTPLTTDQRGTGFARTVGTGVDIGAVEFTTVVPVALTTPPVVATFVVNSLDDGAPVMDGKLTLREAILAATTNTASGDAPAGTAGLDTITFDPTLFGGTILLTTGELSLNGGGAVTIIGPGGVAGGITISGNDATRVFNVSTTDPVILSNLTVTRGMSAMGSGILNTGGDVTLNAVSITGNQSTNTGGGITVTGAAAKLIVNDSLISANRSAGDGAGIDIATAGATVAINRSQIIGNVITMGGDGVGIDNNGILTITDSTIAGNVALSAGTFGGGIENIGTLTVRNSSIYGNTASRGAGINVTSGTATILNSTIAHNIAFGTAGGGGIRVDAGTLTVVNSTIVGNADTSNVADGAGGIGAAVATTVDVFNTVIALNAAGPASADENVDAAGDLDTNTTNFISMNPQLGFLQNNRGPTFTFLPFADSPLVNGGTNASATETGMAGGIPLPTDQRGVGFPRILGTNVDIGAVEFQVAPLISLPGGPIMYTEGAPAIVLDGLATVIDPDSTNFDTGTLTIGFIIGGTMVDQVGIRNEGTGAGQIGVAGSNITFGGVVIGTFVGGTNLSPLVITFDADATPAAVQALLRNITFATTALAPTTLQRTLLVRLTDGDGGTSNTAQKVINVTAAPVTVTINQSATQPDPANANAIQFTVVFSEAVTGFDGSDIMIGGTAKGGTAVVAPSGLMDGTTFTVTITGLTGAGTVTASVGASAAMDTAGNLSTASTSTDNTVTFDPSLPPPPPIGPPMVPGTPINQDKVVQFAVAPGIGGNGVVTVRNADGSTAFNVTPFSPTPSGGVRVATADVNGDGTPDLIAGAGPGGLPQVKVFDGKTQALIRTIDAFESAFTGGVFVAAGDINGDGFADIVITPDEGGGPRVRVFSGKDGSQIADFFGIDDPNFRGGARAALSDVNNDGRVDLLIAAGFGGGPRLAVFDGKSVGSGGTPVKLFNDFFVFEQTLRNGVFITGGDLNGDGFSEVIAGGGPGGGPRVFALSGKDLLTGTQTQMANFFAGDANSRGGIRIAVKDLDGDNRADILAAAGTGTASRVTAYAGKSIPTDGTPSELNGFDPASGFTGGIFVG